MEIKKDENGDIIHFIKEKIKIKNNEKTPNDSDKDFIFNDDIFHYKTINENEMKNLKIQFDLFKIFIYNKLKKKEYKTVVNQIEGNYQIYKNLHESEEILFLKTEILIKIIKNKIKKYSISKEENLKEQNNKLKYNLLNFSRPSTKILKDIYRRNSICNSKLNNLKLASSNIAVSIEKYYSKIMKELNQFIDDIPNNYQNLQVIYIERIIQIYLKLILVKCYHHEKLFQVPYINYYLSLGEKLIINFHDYIKDIKTLNLCEEIFLHIAKEFFINQDFQKTEFYCIKCIDYCFRELIFKFGDNENISLPYLKFEKKNFFNFSLALIVLGFCKEKIGKINSSYKYYCLAKIIYKNFLCKNYKNYSFLIDNLIDRSFQYKEIILQLNKRKNGLLKNEKENKKEIEIKEKKGKQIKKYSEENKENEINKKEKEKNLLKYRLNNKLEDYFFSKKKNTKKNYDRCIQSSEISNRNSKMNSEIIDIDVNPLNIKNLDLLKQLNQTEKLKLKDRIKNIIQKKEKKKKKKKKKLNKKKKKKKKKIYITCF